MSNELTISKAPRLNIGRWEIVSGPYAPHVWVTESRNMTLIRSTWFCLVSTPLTCTLCPAMSCIRRGLLSDAQKSKRLCAERLCR